MRFVAPGLLLTLALSFSPLSSAHCQTTQPVFDPDRFNWAYGLVVDSISVYNNENTKTFVVLREMETRVGDLLDRVKLDRDQHFLTDLSVFAWVQVSVRRSPAGGVEVDLIVTERPTLLLKLIYPIVEYDFNRERFKYGFKWDDRNFRKRLESFSIDGNRNSVRDDNLSIGWSTAWIGWNHIGVGGRLSYFNRGDTELHSTILEQTRGSVGVSLPLTESRINFSQVVANLSVDRNRFGQTEGPSEHQVQLSPSLGYRLDRRDSRLKPHTGEFVSMFLQVFRVVSGQGSTYYRVSNNLRVFRPIGVKRKSVIGLLSDVVYQFGEFPDYARFSIGGAGTLRGYDRRSFVGSHRWIQTLEWRYSPFAKRIYRLPFVGPTDFTLSFVSFMDGAIVWNSTDEFNFDRYHGGFGAGLRLYSPIQDVTRLDFGFNASGNFHATFSTGARF